MSDIWKYIDGVISRKEDSKWIEYWVVIRERYMLFYEHTSETRQSVFKGCIELSDGTKCAPVKRKKYAFPFYVTTAKGRYLLKTQTNLARHQWFRAITLASQGKLPVAISPILNAPECSQNLISSQVDQSKDVVSTDIDSAKTSASDISTGITLCDEYKSIHSEEMSASDDQLTMDAPIHLIQVEMASIKNQAIPLGEESEGARNVIPVVREDQLDLTEFDERKPPKFSDFVVKKNSEAVSPSTGSSLFHNINKSKARTQFSRHLVLPPT